MTDSRPSGPTPLPSWDKIVGDFHPLIVWFAPVEWLATRWFWLWRNSAGLRVFVEGAGAAAVLAGVAGLWFDYNARQEERLARMWDLATDPRPGNSGKIPALEFLVKRGHPLEGVSIGGAYLLRVDLSGADLTGANLSGANLAEANLAKTKLSMAKLVDATIYRANLRSADAGDADLTGANLLGADLAGANLVGVNLNRAWLSGANLAEANIERANLSGANLVAANLSGASLGGSDLAEANLRRAELTGVDFFATIFGHEIVAKGLTAEQLSVACVRDVTKQPALPDQFKNFSLKLCVDDY